MKVCFFIASAMLILTVISCRHVDTEKHIRLINPQATEKTVKLYNFIQDIQWEYTLSGQHNFVGKGSDYTDQLVVLGKGKPIALGEVGEIPDLEVLEQQPQWSWFMPWGWILFMSNETDQIKEVYLSERVLTLDEVTVVRHGQYTVNK